MDVVMNVKKQRRAMMNNLCCPKCGGDVRVMDTRCPKTSNTIRRRRICDRCGYRYSTYEVDSETYNILLKTLNNVASIRCDIKYLLDKIDEME